MGALRLLLALCVFCAHSRPLGNLHWLGGDLAVECFFVISGFYMQMVLTEKYSKPRLGDRWRRQFYAARYLRLAPIYFGCGAFVLLTATLAPRQDFVRVWTYTWALSQSFGNILFKIYLIFTNVTMAFQDLVTFLSGCDGQVEFSAAPPSSDIRLSQGLLIPPAWSLGVELSFYLLAPYLLNLRTRGLVGVLLASFTLKLATIAYLNLDDPWTYRFFPFEIWLFLLGAFVFRYKDLLAKVMPATLNRHAIYIIIFIFVSNRLPAAVPNFIYPLLLSVFLPAIFRATSHSRMDRIVGELSYPFYLFHYSCIMTWAYLNAHLLHLPGASAAWLALAATLTLSSTALALEARFVEPWRARLAEAPAPPQRPFPVVPPPQPRRDDPPSP